MAHVLRADRGGAMKVALLLLCACNSIYGLDATRLQDGAGPDAQAVCMNGPLAFDPKVRQTVLRECDHYTFFGDRAVASCERIPRLAEGPLDQPLVDITI